MTKRLFAIGDIHGNLEALSTLIDSLDLQEEDRLIFLGDYVDRGPDSRAVIDYLIALEKKYHCHFILGNHEEIMLQSIDGDRRYIELWGQIGGNKTLMSYDADDAYSFGRSVPATHLDFLVNKCHPYFFIDHYIFCHAGWDLSKPTQDQDRKTLRYQFIKDAKLFPDSQRHIICGHSAIATGKPMKRCNITCIDTIEAGWLTAYDIRNNCFYQANNNAQTRRFKKADDWSLAKARGLEL